jgi:hypothetical protein
MGTFPGAASHHSSPVFVSNDPRLVHSPVGLYYLCLPFAAASGADRLGHAARK